MSNELFKCALDSCPNYFSKNVWNQRFCSKDCTKLYTNARILAQYHARKNKDTSKRFCKERLCETILSIYNDGIYCAYHDHERNKKKWASWGWGETPLE